MRLKNTLFAILLLSVPSCGSVAQQPSASATQAADPLAELTPEQRDQFKKAAELFGSARYFEALAGFRALLPHLPPASPAQTLVAKYAAEAAIDTGDRDDAMTLLTPMLAADANDWQALSLQARIFAETAQPDKRDADLARLLAMHKANPDSRIGKLQQILLERIPVDNGSVRIWYSLEPWGRYKTYLYARVYDRQGQQVLRVTLESSDFDQPLWSKQHPDLAAKGMRMFSLDGYGQEVKNANGTTAQTHMTFGFFDGQPPYDTVRERIVQIAKGKAAPMTRSEHTAQ